MKNSICLRGFEIEILLSISLKYWGEIVFDDPVLLLKMQLISIVLLLGPVWVCVVLISPGIPASGLEVVHYKSYV